MFVCDQKTSVYSLNDQNTLVEWFLILSVGAVLVLFEKSNELSVACYRHEFLIAASLLGSIQ